MNIPQKLIDIVKNGTADARKYVCSKSVLLFSIYYFSEFFIYLVPTFHEIFYADALRLGNGTLKEALWVAFRESAKTSIAKIFIVWCICFNKKHYICYDSYSKDNSEAALFDIVETLQTNKKIIADFGNLYTEERKKDTPLLKKITSFITSNKIRVRAYSTQESARGLIYQNMRPDLFVFDDIETNKTKESRKVTRKIIKHIKEIRGGLGTTASTLYLGNYITEIGVIAYLMRKLMGEPTAVVRNIAVADKNGKLAWPDKFVKTDKEAHLLNREIADPAKHKVSLEYKKRDLGERSYAEDMMNDPESAGEPFFDRKKIDEAIKRCKPAKSQKSGFYTWADYVLEHRYALGADTSMGVGLDSCTSVLFDFSTKKPAQVGSFADNRIAPHIFAHELHREAVMFGECLIAPETNAKSGGTCLNELKRIHKIDKIYRQKTSGKIADMPLKDLGWDTNASTKPEMFFKFRTAFESDGVEINDIRILMEMRSYTNLDLSGDNDADDEDTEDLDGELTRHFDLLTATCIAWAMNEHATAERIDDMHEQGEYEAPGHAEVNIPTKADEKHPIEKNLHRKELDKLLDTYEQPEYEAPTAFNT